jgi:peptidoglycan-associated lipoprotein
MNRSLLSVVLALGLSGCAAKSHNTVESTRVVRPTPPAPAAQAGADTRSPQDDEAQALASLGAAPIYFSLDSAQLTPQAQDELERLALALRQRQLARVTVSGHTCELGTTEYNLALGKQRAEIVRTYLTRLGVEPQRISTVSFGEEHPADERTPDKNRRAEFSFRLAEQAHAGEL